MDNSSFIHPELFFTGPLCVFLPFEHSSRCQMSINHPHYEFHAPLPLQTPQCVFFNREVNSFLGSFLQSSCDFTRPPCIIFLVTNELDLTNPSLKSLSCHSMPKLRHNNVLHSTVLLFLNCATSLPFIYPILQISDESLYDQSPQVFKS